MLGGINFNKVRRWRKFTYLLLLLPLFVKNLVLIDRATAQTLCLERDTPQNFCLRRGAINPTVADLQVRLRDAGYYSGPIDGGYGEATEAAVTKFQQDRGLEADGIAGPATLAALGEPSVEQRSQPSVANLQIRLRDRGFYDGPISGTYDEATEAAVRQFQQSQGLTVDGIAGPNTLAALSGPLDVEALGSELRAEGKPFLDISELQRKLRDLGYDVVIDGIYGPQTQAALVRYAVETLIYPDLTRAARRIMNYSSAVPIEETESGGVQNARQKKVAKACFKTDPSQP
jgi:peptidoglycan hydrolase-like protein with peptidoglycan-binding domain